jgi:hypothetical protein
LVCASPNLRGRWGTVAQGWLKCLLGQRATRGGQLGPKGGGGRSIGHFAAATAPPGLEQNTPTHNPKVTKSILCSSITVEEMSCSNIPRNGML